LTAQASPSQRQTNSPMKIQTQAASFDEPVPEVARAVRVVLATNPPYRSTVEEQADTLFATTIQPTKGLVALLFMDTAAKVRLEKQAQGCLLTVEITPPDGVAADIFGFYKKFMKNLIGAVRSELEKQG
jgi:hypothetical protein